MLTGDELTAMREELELTLADQCVITRASTVSDGQGGGSATWATAGTVYCRVDLRARGAVEDTRADRLASQSEWTITFPYSTDVRVTDRLTVGTVLYEPYEVRAPKTWELSRRVLAKVIA